MKQQEKIYLPYVPSATSVNYIYLFYLYHTAYIFDDRSIGQDIVYKSVNDLVRQMELRNIKIKEPTLRRFLANKKNKDFFTITENNGVKYLKLNNDFRQQAHNTYRFVVLCPKTYTLLVEQKDDLLARYTIYLKYMCGLNKSGQTDTTINQFLSTFCYSTKSNENKRIIGKYNSLLEDKGIISIKRDMMENGRWRNTYTFLDT